MSQNKINNKIFIRLYSICVVILLMTLFHGCKGKNKDRLALEICDCFTEKNNKFVVSNNEIKRNIIAECFNSKLENVARKKNEEHLENSDRSKFLDYLFEIGSETTIALKSSCPFFYENGEEIMRLLEQEKDKPKKQKPKETEEFFVGKIISIVDLEYESNDLLITLDSGENMNLFYKSLSKNYIGKRVEFTFETKIIKSDTFNWIKRLHLIK